MHACEDDVMSVAFRTKTCVSAVQQIIDFNNKVRACLDNGVKIEHGSGLIELWDFLQVSTLFGLSLGQ